MEIDYSEFMLWYYFCCHSVDDKNYNCQGQGSFEEAFTPHCWELRLFGSIVALSQVNNMLVFDVFKHLPHKESCFSNTEFTQSIVEVLIYNTEFNDDNDIEYQAPETYGPQDLPCGMHF